MRKQLCPKKHNILLYGRTKSGFCKRCQAIYHKNWEKINKERTKKYRCNSVVRKKLYDKNYYIKHTEQINKRTKDYYKNNKETAYLRQKIYNRNHLKDVAKCKQIYKIKHPEVGRLASLKHKLSRRLRVPNFGQVGIKKFIKDCPTKMEIDHIIPLHGKLVSGLHVIWNLQYLTKKQNRTKYNQFDGTSTNNNWRLI